MKKVNSRTGDVTDYDTSVSRVSGIVEHGGNIFVLHKLDNTQKIEKYLADGTNRQGENRMELFSFPTKNFGFKAPSLAVSGRYIAASNPDDNELILYFRNERTTGYLIVTDVAFGELTSLCFLPDGDLLSLVNGVLTRNRIVDGALSVVWTSNESSYGSHISTACNELIYVYSYYKEKTIYIVSPEDGKKLKLICYWL